MTQALVDRWNSDPEVGIFRTVLGLRLLEADGEHALAEITTTDFNKLRGYFAGHALPGMVEAIAGIVANYGTWVDSSETGEDGGIGWVMTDMCTTFVGNTRSELAVCERNRASRVIGKTMTHC